MVYDLYEAIKQYCNDNEKDTLSMLKSLSDIIEIRKTALQFVDELEELIEETAIENGLCPDCLEKLDIKYYVQYQGEHHGTPSYEEISTYYCDSCGWVEQD